MNCKTARQQLGTHENGGRSDSEQLRLAVEHVANCSLCAKQLKALKTTLIAEDRLTQDLMQMANQANLPEPAYLPTFDLSFLKIVAPQAESLKPESIWQKIGSSLPREIWQLTEELTVFISQKAASFGNLAEFAQPMPQLAGALRNAEQTRIAQALFLPANEAKVNIQLSVGPIVEERTVILLRISDEKGQEPCTGISVRLYDDSQQLLSISTTAADGTAIFRDMLLGRYQLQLRLEDSTWEIPMLLIEKKHDEA